MLPVGNGTLLLGASIGFKDLLAAGFIDTMPELIAVQSSQCDPLAQAYRGDLAEPAAITAGATVVDGIAVAAPLRGRQILEAVRESGGSFISVDDTEIEAARREIRKHGYSIEPTSAAAPAGLLRYRFKDKRVVTVFTGHGRKPGAPGANL